MRKLISALSAVLVSIGTLVPLETASAAPMTIQQPVEISKDAPNANVQTVHYRNGWNHRHHRRWDRRHYGWERRHHRRWDRRYYGERRYYRPYYGERRYYRPYYGDRPYRRSGIYLQF